MPNGIPHTSKILQYIILRICRYLRANSVSTLTNLIQQDKVADNTISPYNLPYTQIWRGPHRAHLIPAIIPHPCLSLKPPFKPLSVKTSAYCMCIPLKFCFGRSQPLRRCEICGGSFLLKPGYQLRIEGNGSSLDIHPTWSCCSIPSKGKNRH